MRNNLRFNEEKHCINVTHTADVVTQDAAVIVSGGMVSCDN